MRPFPAARRYIPEIRQSTGEDLLARNVYLCADCPLGHFDGVTAPPGFVSFTISQVERDSVFPLDLYQRYDPAQVPEPGTLLLVGAGVAGLALRRGRARG